MFMKYRKEILSVSIVSFVGILSSVLVLCKPDMNLVCHTSSDLSGIMTLLFGSLFFSTLPLFFLKEAVYKTWRNFSLVFIPLMLVFIFTSPESSGGLFGTTSLFDRESAAMVGTYLYLILSYTIIAVKAWKTRGKAG